MAYNKKYAELGESVIDYVNNREDAIEASFDDVDTDIIGVSQGLSALGQELGALNNQVNSSTTTEIDTPTDVLSGFNLSGLRVVKRNKVVTIYGSVEGSITPSFQKICKIGTGFRPPTVVFAVAWSSFNDNSLSQIQLSTNGDMYIRSQLNATSAGVSISYIVD